MGDAWRGWDTNIHHWRRDWWILCFAYKWLGEKKVHVVGQPDFKGYQKNKESDLEVVKELHRLFDEAEVVIAHNGDNFDEKKLNSRVIINSLPPIALHKQIDTKKVAKRYFNFTSNKLDDLAGYFGIPGKLDTGGYGLWLACEQGDPKAWAKMMRYNKQDVVLLEQVYLKMRPWIHNHPAVNLVDGRPDSCPKCGGGPLIRHKKKQYSKIGWKQQYQCSSCGGYSLGKEIFKPENAIQFTN